MSVSDEICIEQSFQDYSKIKKDNVDLLKSFVFNNEAYQRTIKENLKYISIEYMARSGNEDPEPLLEHLREYGQID